MNYGVYCPQCRKNYKKEFFCYGKPNLKLSRQLLYRCKNY